jgi:hypothetical protein
VVVPIPTPTISYGKEYGPFLLSLDIRLYSGELSIMQYQLEALLATKEFIAPSGALGVFKGKKPFPNSLWIVAEQTRSSLALS